MGRHRIFICDFGLHDIEYKELEERDMGVVDKTVDTAGGTLMGGLKGGAAGLLTTMAIGAAILGGVGVALAVGGIIGVGGALGLAAAGALAGAFPPISVPVMTTFAAIGALFGGAKRLLGGKSEEPSLDQQIAAAKIQNNELNSMIAKRQAAASSFDNPDATTGFAAKAQAPMPQQSQATDTPDKSGYVAKTQTTTTTVEPQRA